MLEASMGPLDGREMLRVWGLGMLRLFVTRVVVLESLELACRIIVATGHNDFRARILQGLHSQSRDSMDDKKYLVVDAGAPGWQLASC